MINKSINISEKAWEETKDIIFYGELNFLLKRVAVGLVGHGSECYGYDDEISKDHDFGVGFCIWLFEEDFNNYGKELVKRYNDSLRKIQKNSSIREYVPSIIGPISIEDFYINILGEAFHPSTNEEWLSLREIDLSKAVNGKIFLNNNRKFNSIRNHLLNYYPDDIWYKKLSYNLFYLGQKVQYNFFRALNRNDQVVAKHILINSLENLISLVYLLNRKYKPYYKWEIEGLKSLNLLGKETVELIESVYNSKGLEEVVIEKYFPMLIKIMNILDEYVILDSKSLIDYSGKIHSKIEDMDLRNSDIMR
ncbi:MAG: DUF4037 domain-containing protein [Tissierellia bacterium]|nr:DUF4037 domain-containing protein [Tissierellia bacterium]